MFNAFTYTFSPTPVFTCYFIILCGGAGGGSSRTHHLVSIKNAIKMVKKGKIGQFTERPDRKCKKVSGRLKPGGENNGLFNMPQ